MTKCKPTLANLEKRIAALEQHVVDLTGRAKPAAVPELHGDKRAWRSKGGYVCAEWCRGALTLYAGEHQGNWTIDPVDLSRELRLTQPRIAALAAQAVAARHDYEAEFGSAH